jgi:hypothetical protein
MDDTRSARRETRRAILKRAAYVAPVVLSLAAEPSFAQRGSQAQVRPVPREWWLRLLRFLFHN